ncbi:hypothetical protein P175DRAFT_0528816 [Aspergillus ochraceoroseus IBT 24754]|uniref:Uncharacterized protein n=1 Tax=Aspergillus ochraceoroseus IBT 24754 TaxID=1392256 RepID=A0A2T5M9S1_9EURO|nr:uncharacterized protein P175DRAFT_0528816 [Aspergillus ochraceoroseus IBT 24754]PTU25276.1 hypothetical protein P175DRAFT_0528816 [Aspergillus ochraceoroseus IBT 24754]
MVDSLKATGLNPPGHLTSFTSPTTSSRVSGFPSPCFGIVYSESLRARLASSPPVYGDTYVSLSARTQQWIKYPVKRGEDHQLPLMIELRAIYRRLQKTPTLYGRTSASNLTTKIGYLVIRHLENCKPIAG